MHLERRGALLGERSCRRKHERKNWSIYKPEGKVCELRCGRHRVMRSSYASKCNWDCSSGSSQMSGMSSGGAQAPTSATSNAGIAVFSQVIPFLSGFWGEVIPRSFVCSNGVWNVVRKKDKVNGSCTGCSIAPFHRNVCVLLNQLGTGWFGHARICVLFCVQPKLC